MENPDTCQTCDEYAARLNRMTRERDATARISFSVLKQVEFDLNEILICLDSRLGTFGETEMNMVVGRAEQALKRIRDLRD